MFKKTIGVIMNSISELWTKEDYWAIWLGFALLLTGLVLFGVLSSPPNLTARLDTINSELNRAAARAP